MSDTTTENNYKESFFSNLSAFSVSLGRPVKGLSRAFFTGFRARWLRHFAHLERGKATVNIGLNTEHNWIVSTRICVKLVSIQTHIHPILETLHWLPVTHRIQYKIQLPAAIPSLEQPLSIHPISFNPVLQQDNYDLLLTHEPLSPPV